MTLIETVKSVVDHTTDDAARSKLKPYTDKTIDWQTQTLVKRRLAVLTNEWQIQHNVGDTAILDSKHYVQKLHDALTEYWPEAVVKYREVCKILNLTTMETP